ncbi:hypothetical protein JCM3770_001341 [Rhodotorula araucariae]
MRLLDRVPGARAARAARPLVQTLANLTLTLLSSPRARAGLSALADRAAALTTSTSASSSPAAGGRVVGIGAEVPGSGVRQVVLKSARWWDDEEGDSPLGLALRILETFFPFVNLCILISQAAFQSRWDVGVSGRVGVSLFFCIEALAHGGLVLSTFLLADKLRFLRPLERGLKQIRIAVILQVFQVVCMLLMALVTTVSANVGGCKDATTDAHAEIEGYSDALPGFCRGKRASAAFFWLNLFAWAATLGLTFLVFARVRRNPRSTGFAPPGPAAPGAQFPGGDDDDDEAWARPSFDAELELPPGAGATQAHAAARGYRPSHDYAAGGERLFDEPAPASGYAHAHASRRYARAPSGGDRDVDDEPLRDPFEDQGYDDDDSSHTAARYAGFDDPYEAIRKSMDVHSSRT